MNRIAVHLWKEWRTHRLALLVTLLGFPLALATAVTLSGSKYARDWSFALVVGACGIAAMLVAVGGELLAERGERGVTWLERVPRSLGSAFAAKLALLLLASLAAVAASLGILAVLEGIRDVELTSKPLDWIRALFLFLPLVVWTFALSAWALRGGLAFVTALFLIGLVVGPGVALVTQGYQAIGRPLIWSLTALTSTGLLAAWLAFVPRWMRGVGRGRVLVVVVAPALVLVPPAWGWAAQRWHERTTLDPRWWHVLRPVLTQDARHVVATVQPGAPGWDTDTFEYRTVRIDLETGAWATVGGPGGVVRSTRGNPANGETVLAVISPNESAALDPFDGALQPSAPVPEIPPTSPAGLGWRTWDGQGYQVFDPTRGRTFSRADLKREIGIPIVLPGRWLVRDGVDWCWLDPETMVEEPTGWKREHLDLVAVLDDGRLILRELRPGASRAVLWRLEPCTGERREVWHGSAGWTPRALQREPWKAEPRPLFRVRDRVLVFDPGTGGLNPGPILPFGIWYLLDWLGPEEVLLEGGRSLLRVDLEASTCEVVFPR